jgi:hypothetical protein
MLGFSHDSNDRKAQSLRILPVLLALLSGMLPAFAQGSGFTLFGNRDFEMDGVQGDGGKMMRMRYLAERRILRIEALDGSGQVMLRDLAKGDVLILVQEGRQCIYGSRGRPIIGMNIVPGEAVREVAGWITPVPGGVGPMTITMLLVNTVEAAERSLQAA